METAKGKAQAFEVKGGMKGLHQEEILFIGKNMQGYCAGLQPSLASLGL